jgi:hypothetical protein
MSASRTAVLLGLVLLGACTFASLPVDASAAGAASGWTNGACVGTSGITVVVDATNAGGDVNVHCALGAQSTGWDALTNAGHVVSAVTNQPQAVCTIDGKPAQGYPTCWATKYWSYWHAPNAHAGATWTYSRTGSVTYKPAPGSVEGWRFTDVGKSNDPPSVGPVFAGAIPPPSKPPVTKPPATVPPPGRAGSQPPVGGGGAPVTGAGPTAPGAAAPGSTGVGTGPATTVAPTGNAPTSSSSAATAGAAAAGRATTTTTPGTTGASGDVTGAAVHGENVSSTKDASQVPWTTIVGVLLIVAFAGGAGFVAWRRRAASSATGG